MTVMLMAACLVGGCGTSPKARPQNEPAPARTVLPAPDAALAGLSFLAGRWACVNPNKSVNREHWMSASGTSMVGMFQQLRRDGSAGFYEVTAIVAGPDGVMLHHRHMHARFAIDPKRGEVDVFRLRTLDAGRAVFEPVTGSAAGPGGIESMTYLADGSDKLVQQVAFKPDSKEKPFATVYIRED